jgi:hypothetical protein
MQNELRLNGPGGTISAFCGFAIFAEFPATDGYDSRIEEYVACYDDLSNFSSSGEGWKKFKVGQT